MRLPDYEPGARWGLCLSGGADSTALLLKCLEVGFPVVALHFNHAFEDEDGDADERYVRALCAAKQVPLEVGRCMEAWATGETKEVFARRHRMDFFAECARRLHLTGLLLAHHAGDRAEHLVLRLARGCGAEGLTRFGFENEAPWDARVRLVRPLLDETHIDQVQWLTSRGISWCEDVSNADLTIPRNAIRATLPKVLPHFVAGVNASAELLSEENAFIAACAKAAVLEQTERVLSVKPATHMVLLRRILRAWLPELTRHQTQRLLELPPGKVAMVAQKRVIRRVSETQWQRLSEEKTPKPDPIVIEARGDYRFGHWRILVGDETALLRLPLPLTVRARQNGDRIRPRGLRGSRKVQDVLTELHVPAAERDGYPLFCASSGVLLAVPGLRPAALPEGVATVGISLQRLDDV
ncbi:MAG: tRNA lysidine(34) synthetase TilS [Kiritimatiellae bacterium]|nr:tRNA lysidine(34) synthetase TilS [Kiritimatiellia bacterium]